MLALGIETESEDIRKDMVKRLERQKIQAAFNNMRAAGIKSFAFFIFGYPGESATTLEATTNYAIELDPDFANFYPAVPYPGTDLYDKCIREGWLDPSHADWTKMEYSYYLLRGNGLDERIVMEAINRAKRRFFLRPSYITRHLGDVARLALTKQAIVWQVLSRTLFGARVADTSVAGGHASSPAEMRR
jgi:anaerobic magnesium-protoporphyrin IX monomethyl ester cyclase